MSPDLNPTFSACLARVGETATPEAPGAASSRDTVLVQEPVTGSIGVAEWRAGDTEAVLVGRADAAMYAAKAAGRNRVEVEK